MMRRSELMSIVIVAIVLAVSFQQASALKCWECSWSGVELNTKFCDDPFEANATDQWAYGECKNQTGSNVYCRKSINVVNNSTIVSRGCYYRPVSATKETCSDKSPSSVTVETCLLCSEDGCNSAAQFTSTIAFIAISMITAHILSA